MFADRFGIGIEFGVNGFYSVTLGLNQPVITVSEPNWGLDSVGATTEIGVHMAIYKFAEIAESGLYVTVLLILFTYCISQVNHGEIIVSQGRQADDAAYEAQHQEVPGTDVTKLRSEVVHLLLVHIA